MSQMIELGRIVSLNLCLLALVVWLLRSLRAQNSVGAMGQNLAQILICLLGLVLGNVKIAGFCALEYYYAFFGAPCGLSVGLSVVYLLRAFGACDVLSRFGGALGSGVWASFCAHGALLPFGVVCLWAGFGTILYLSVLGFLPFDLYYVDSRVQVLVVCGMLVCAFAYSRAFGILGVLGLWWGLLAGSDMGLFESVMDVGLYVVCLVGVLLRASICSLCRYRDRSLAWRA